MNFHDGPWYHGSPVELTSLRKGTMVTPFQAVAKAFSHRPSILTFSGDIDSVKHDGRVPGHLYVVSEDVPPEDLRVLPWTGETHWEIQRDLRVELVGDVPVSDPPQLVGEELRKAQEKNADVGLGAFFSD